MPDFMNSNDIYIWSSYISGAVVLAALAVASWAAKQKDERNLRKLEKHIRERSEK